MSVKVTQHKINVKVNLDECIKRIAEDTSSNIKNNARASNIGGTEYVNGWTKKKTAKGYVIYNEKQPSLAHLLENGHIVKNAYGASGKGKKKRVAPRPHIRPAYKTTLNEMAKYKELIKIENK